MSGPVGVFYRQFSITMASSIILSGIVALTLTPALCALILKNNHGKAKKKTPVTIFRINSTIYSQEVQENTKRHLIRLLLRK